MKAAYDRYETRYICTRCNTPINVASDTFHWFSGPDDPAFWCPTCEDLPRADFPGTPAHDLPAQFQLPKDFTCRIVPLAEPGDVKEWNLLYRPYSKRSFLRQYAEWMQLKGTETCHLQSSGAVSATFDPATQGYTNQLTYELQDTCSDAPCQFLRSCSLQPDEIGCLTIKALCDTKGTYGLCQTGDEAMLLQWYVIITGAEHFPMLIPQASILKGKRRADFVCFIPLSKFQYKQVAVLIDRPGKSPDLLRAETEDYKQAGFEVRRIDIHPEGKSYFKLARDLATWIEQVGA
jgi:hypothetical protein